jgi:hypothetical protein
VFFAAGLPALFVLGTLASWASGSSPASAPVTPAQSAQAQPAPRPAPVPANPFYTGDGGKGASIAILLPRAAGLAANEDNLPALVQGEFVSDFTGYSAIAVLDRARLDEQYAEMESG